jgi:hypothetical protein
MEVHLRNKYRTKLFKCYFKTPFLLPRENTTFALKISSFTNNYIVRWGNALGKVLRNLRITSVFQGQWTAIFETIVYFL